jgi:hypothetical protein
MNGAARVFKDGSCMTTRKWLGPVPARHVPATFMQGVFGIDWRGAPAPSEPDGGGEPKPEDGAGRGRP